MRQSRFRSTSCTIKLSDGKGEHDYFVALGHQEETLYPDIRSKDGALDFFRDRCIKWWKGTTWRDGPSDVPTRNMVSSQVACVNFLLPLAAIDHALTAVARAIDNDVQDVIGIVDRKGNQSRVEFEWIGIDKSLEGGTRRGQYETSVDSFMVAETDRGRRAYLMEWKYTEGETYLSTKPKYRGEGYRKEKQLNGYSDLYYADSSSFDATIPMRELFYDPFDQIMRNRLLADRMVANGELGVSDAKVVVVVPEENLAYRTAAYGKKTTSPPLVERFPDLKTVDEVMRATLKDPDTTFKMVTPTQLREAVVDECGDAVSDWAAYIRERYGW